MPSVNKHYERSFARIVADEAHAEAFFKLFYQNFMAESAEVRFKFRGTDWQRQVTLLKNMLIYLQRFYETGEPSQRLQDLAKSHSRAGYDISPELYNQWLHAFFETLKEMDPKYSRRVESAWLEVLTPGIDYMISHYN